MENLDELLLSINAAVWHMQLPSKKFIYVNQHLSDICGITLSDLKDDPDKYNNLIHPEDKQRVLNEFKQVKKGRSIETEYRILTTGGTRWICHKEMMLCDANGKSETLAGIISDITARKLTEIKLAESEKTYRYLFTNNPSPLWIYDVNTLQVLAVNDAAIIKYGYTREEWLSITIAEIWPGVEVSPLKDGIKKIGSGFKGLGYWHQIKKDGTIIRVSISGHDLNYENHNARIVLITDLTDILNARDELDITSSNLKALINNTADLIYSIDRNYCLMSINWAFKEHIFKLYGVYLKEGDILLLGGAYADFNAKWKAIYDRCLNGETFTFLEEFNFNNIPSIEEVRFNTMYDINGKIIGASCFVHDITRQIGNERKITAQNQRLREIASLASHEIRGQVASIMGILGILNRAEFDEENKELLSYIDQATNTLDAVIHTIVDKSYEVAKQDFLLKQDPQQNQSVNE